MKARISQSNFDATQELWNLLVLIALNKAFGFGNKRLKKTVDEMRQTMEEFTRDACCTDKPYRKETHTDISTAIIKAVDAAKSRGIDYENILGVEFRDGAGKIIGRT